MPRQVDGTYNLPAGNPVTPNTDIESTWANSTMTDLANALSDSLSRSGSGGMLAPLLFSDGTISAPGISWINEPTSGLRRSATNDMRVVVGGADAGRWNASEFRSFLPIFSEGGLSCEDSNISSFSSAGPSERRIAAYNTLGGGMLRTVSDGDVRISQTSDGGGLEKDWINFVRDGGMNFYSNNVQSMNLSSAGNLSILSGILSVTSSTTSEINLYNTTFGGCDIIASGTNGDVSIRQSSPVGGYEKNMLALNRDGGAVHYYDGNPVMHVLATGIRLRGPGTGEGGQIDFFNAANTARAGFIDINATDDIRYWLDGAGEHQWYSGASQLMSIDPSVLDIDVPVEISGNTTITGRAVLGSDLTWSGDLDTGINHTPGSMTMTCDGVDSFIFTNSLGNASLRPLLCDAGLFAPSHPICTAIISTTGAILAQEGNNPIASVAKGGVGIYDLTMTSAAEGTLMGCGNGLFPNVMANASDHSSTVLRVHVNIASTGAAADGTFSVIIQDVG